MGFRIRVQRIWKIKLGKLLWSFRKRPNSRFPTYFWTNPGVVPLPGLPPEGLEQRFTERVQSKGLEQRFRVRVL